MAAETENPGDTDTTNLSLEGNLPVADSTLQALYGRFDLKYPLEIPPYATLEEKRQLYHYRMPRVQAVRRELVNSICVKEGRGSDIAVAAQIALAISVPLDEICFQQITVMPKEPASWRAIAPVASQALISAINQILVTDYMASYLGKNQGMRQTLMTLRDEVIIEDDPLRLVQLARRMEEHALASYHQKGQLVLLLTLSQWFTDTDHDLGDTYNILEPDMRLLLPYEEKTKNELDDIVAAFWEIAKRLSPNANDSPAPSVIIGEALLGAGSEVLTQGSGEAFEGNGAVIVTNYLKTVDVINTLFEKIGYNNHRPTRTLITYLYIAHELMHKRYEVRKIHRIEELLPDLGALHVVFSVLDSQWFRDISVAASGECAHQVDDSDVEYRFSGIALMFLLRACGVLKTNVREGLRINGEKETMTRIIEYSQQVYQSLRKMDCAKRDWKNGIPKIIRRMVTSASVRDFTELLHFIRGMKPDEVEKLLKEFQE